MARPWMMLAVTAVLAGVLSWCFARPAPLRALVAPGLLSIGFAVALAGLAWVAIDATAFSAMVPAAIVTALILDLAAEARARWRARLVPIEEHHDVDAADAALDAGGGYLRGMHLRALLRFFGPFVPMWRMVPETDPVGGRPAQDVIEPPSSPSVGSPT